MQGVDRTKKQLDLIWFTMEHLIFLWNYRKKPTDPESLIEFNGLDQPIISLEAVIPKQQVFVDSVKYLLVVATATEVIVLALRQDQHDESVDIIPSKRFISFHSLETTSLWKRHLLQNYFSLSQRSLLKTTYISLSPTSQRSELLDFASFLKLL